MGLYIMNEWSDDIEKILNDIRINSNNFRIITKTNIIITKDY